MRTTVLLACLAMIVAACADAAEEPPETLTLVSHNSFAEAVTEETFAAFREATGIQVEVVGGGDAGSMVNQVILSKDNPFADVMFGVDDTFLSRALEEDVFRPHEAEGVDSVSDELVDPEQRVTPIDFGDVCVNYDKGWFEGEGVDVPATLDDLAASADQLVIEHPATSSPGLAFVLATIEAFGEDGWLDYWARLRDGGVNVTADWDTAYYNEFTRYGGDDPLVVSYASSPPAEVIFAEEPTDTAPTGVIEAGCYRQVEYAGVLAGTEYPDAAGRLVDYMLSVEFQETIPLNWFVFPVNPDATLPEEFVEHTVIPEDPARMSAERIAENRDAWIDQWVEVMEQR
jgi:thiamine transport system substrate-binding protein